MAKRGWFVHGQVLCIYLLKRRVGHRVIYEMKQTLSTLLLESSTLLPEHSTLLPA